MRHQQLQETRRLRKGGLAMAALWQASHRAVWPHRRPSPGDHGAIHGNIENGAVNRIEAEHQHGLSAAEVETAAVTPIEEWRLWRVMDNQRQWFKETVTGHGGEVVLVTAAETMVA